MSKVSKARFPDPTIRLDFLIFFSLEAEIRQLDAIVFSVFFIVVVVVVVVVGVRLEDGRPQDFIFVDLESRIDIS